LHPDFDSGNLVAFMSKGFDKCRRHLPELDRDRAAIGVNNYFAALEVGNVGAGLQVGRQSDIKQGLQLPQPVGLL